MLEFCSRQQAGTVSFFKDDFFTVLIERSSDRAKIEDITIQRNSFARNRPGQIRFPNPKAARAGSRMSGFQSPSLKYLCGLNRVGSGYISSSIDIDLEWGMKSKETFQ